MTITSIIVSCIACCIACIIVTSTVTSTVASTVTSTVASIVITINSAIDSVVVDIFDMSFDSFEVCYDENVVALLYFDRNRYFEEGEEYEDIFEELEDVCSEDFVAFEVSEDFEETKIDAEEILLSWVEEGKRIMNDVIPDEYDYEDKLWIELKKLEWEAEREEFLLDIMVEVLEEAFDYYDRRSAYGVSADELFFAA